MLKPHQFAFALIPFLAGFGLALHWFQLSAVGVTNPSIAISAMAGMAAAKLYFWLCKGDREDYVAQSNQITQGR